MDTAISRKENYKMADATSSAIQTTGTLTDGNTTQATADPAGAAASNNLGGLISSVTSSPIKILLVLAIGYYVYKKGWIKL